MKQSITKSYDPADTKRYKHVIITSKRRFDIIITCLLRYLVFTGSHSVEGQYHADSKGRGFADGCIETIVFRKWINVRVMNENTGTLFLGKQPQVLTDLQVQSQAETWKGSFPATGFKIQDLAVIEI